MPGRGERVADPVRVVLLGDCPQVPGGGLSQEGAQAGAEAGGRGAAL